MFLFGFVIVLCSVLIQGIHGQSDSESRIAGGLSTTIEKHPYQVYFEYKNCINRKCKDFQCGGSIISPRHVLTAAHCVEGAIKAKVRAGSTRSDTGGAVYNVKQMDAHPQYDSDTYDNDVALVTLERDIYLDGKTTKVIGLPKKGARVKPGTEVVVTGWGLTSIRDQGSEELMEVTVPIIPKKNCRRIWALKLRNVTSRMFCAGGRQGDACHGDSGGPAVDSATGVQIGVVSWGYGHCKRSHFPGVYADLTNRKIRKWIKRTIGV